MYYNDTPTWTQTTLHSVEQFWISSHFSAQCIAPLLERKTNGVQLIFQRYGMTKNFLCSNWSWWLGYFYLSHSLQNIGQCFDGVLASRQPWIWSGHWEIHLMAISYPSQISDPSDSTMQSRGFTQSNRKHTQGQRQWQRKWWHKYADCQSVYCCSRQVCRLTDRS